MEEKIQTSVRVNAETLERLSVLAAKAGTSRNNLIDNVLTEAVGPLETCDKLGFYRLAVLLGDMGHALRKWAKEPTLDKAIKEDLGNG